jgi:hypothetical protein
MLKLWHPNENSQNFCKVLKKEPINGRFITVRDEEAALDIVQDSMMKLAEHYGDKPVNELPMLFQRILSNTTLDWFRRDTTRKALFSNFSDFESGKDDGDFDILEALSSENESQKSLSAEDNFASSATVRDIEEENTKSPASSTRSLPAALLGGSLTFLRPLPLWVARKEASKHIVRGPFNLSAKHSLPRG